MPSRCKKCKRLITATTESIKCTKRGCDFVYHRDCVGIPLKLQMTRGWNCPECLVKAKQDAVITKKRFPQICNETVSDDEFSTTADTQTTDNLNASFLSLPDMTTENNQQISELKTAIEELKAKLESANVEIDRLSSENNDLKQQVSNCENKIKILNKIYTEETTAKKRTPNKNKKQKEITTPIIRRQEPKNNITVEDHYNANQNDPDPQEKLSTGLTSKNTLTKNAEIQHTPERVTLEDSNNTQTTHKSQKTKVCIISDNDNGTILSTMINTFPSASYCHYAYPNGGLEVSLKDIGEKLHGYTTSDYCIIIVGEADFRSTKNYVELVESVRTKLIQIKNTNIAICTPTYICGAIMYNARVELFNSLLYLDTRSHGYAFLYDSNAELTLDMFSYRTGKLNRPGMRSIFANLKKTMIFYHETIPTASINDAADKFFRNNGN